MLKFGNISDIDAEKGLAKVEFDDDGIVSKWLPIAVTKSKDDSFSFMYDPGEHVACLMDEHCENGVILTAIYDASKKPDGGNKDKVRVKFKDGTFIEYDRSANKLTADVKGDVEVKATKNIKAEATMDIEATAMNIKATAQVAVEVEAVQVKATASATAEITAPTITIAGNVTISGTVTVSGTVTAADCIAGAITLLTHKHPTAAPGPPSTPIP